MQFPGLKRLAARFFGSEKGNVAIMFAIAVVPMLLAAGASVDMVRANRAQAMLQAAADAAALAAAASVEAQNGGGNAVNMMASSLVDQYVAANDIDRAVDFVDEVESKIDEKKGVLMVRVKGRMKTSLMSLAGIEEMSLEAYTEVGMSSRALEVVLVLDNTGSMSGQKIEDLKAAAHNLVKTLMEDQPANARVKIGVVPFAEYVNIGVGTNGNGWLANDPAPAGSTWAGCVGSRTAPHDQEAGSSGGGKFTPVGDVRCVTPLLTLTDDRAAIDARIDAMGTEGNTYIPAGLLWGWNVLDDKEPLGGAMSPSELSKANGKKALVLMTDGDNTIASNGMFHVSTEFNADKAAADQLTQSLCSNVKAADILVFTVAFQIANPDTVAMIQSCATDQSMAFDASNGAALNAAFTQIGTQLATLFLSK